MIRITTPINNVIDVICLSYQQFNRCASLLILINELMRIASCINNLINVVFYLLSNLQWCQNVSRIYINICIFIYILSLFFLRIVCMFMVSLARVSYVMCGVLGSILNTYWWHFLVADLYKVTSTVLWEQHRKIARSWY